MPKNTPPALAPASLKRWSQAFADLADRIKSAKMDLRAPANVGKYADCTVYSVRETKVRGYLRRSFIAVRMKKPKHR